MGRFPLPLSLLLAPLLALAGCAAPAPAPAAAPIEPLTVTDTNPMPHAPRRPARSGWAWLLACSLTVLLAGACKTSRRPISQEAGEARMAAEMALS